MLEEYSDSRIATIIVSLLGILILFFLVKKDNLTIGDYFVWLSLLISIVFLSLFPSSLVYLTGFISLSFNERYDRLIIISYIFVFFLITLIFYYRLKINMLRYAFVETMQLNEIHKFLGNSKKNKKELMIAVPAYNEENNINAIIRRIPKNICGLKPYILVISDGSTDNTYSIAKKNRVSAIQLPLNFGQCVAYRTAYKIAIKLKFKYLVHLDADGQYNPEEINKLVKPLINKEADFVSGSRLRGKYEEMFALKKIIRTIGLLFFNIVLTILLRKKITDSASGFRSITVELLSKLNFNQEQFHSSELLIEAIGKKARFIEIPVSFNKRDSGKSKKPNFLKYGFGFSNTIIRTWFRIK